MKRLPRETWCPTQDSIARRTHMALCEAGVPAELERADDWTCHHMHLNVTVCPGSRRDLIKAASVAMPEAMFFEWLESHGWEDDA